MLDINITLIISFLALIIAIFGYYDNRIKLKILMNKEIKRKDIENTIGELKNTYKSLKNLPEFVHFGLAYISDISQEVYENNNLNLTIEFRKISFPTEYYFNLHPLSKGESRYIEYDTDSITASKLHNYIKEHPINDNTLVSLNFISRPITLPENYFHLFIINGLSNLENNLNNLKDHRNFIESFDAEIFQIIENNYQEILEILADSLHNKVYNLEFDKNMKPSEIEGKIFDIFNYDQILEKVEILSSEVSIRVEKLIKKLTELNIIS